MHAKSSSSMGPHFAVGCDIWETALAHEPCYLSARNGEWVFASNACCEEALRRDARRWGENDEAFAAGSYRTRHVRRELSRDGCRSASRAVRQGAGVHACDLRLERRLRRYQRRLGHIEPLLGSDPGRGGGPP